MLPLSRFFFANACHTNSPQRFSVSVKLYPRPFRNASLVINMAPHESVVTEYAKSNRSSCKACSKPIESKALRLGLVSKDKRGYVVTKWHHLRCFPLLSHFTPDTITGFSSLKNSDQEALKKLFAEQDSSEEAHKTTEDIQNEQQETEERDSKKRKESGSITMTRSKDEIKSKFSTLQHTQAQWWTHARFAGFCCIEIVAGDFLLKRLLWKGVCTVGNPKQRSS